MKRACTFFGIILSTNVLIWSQPAQMTFLGNWHDDGLILTSWLDSRYNDVWGFVMNGHEYAAIGSTEGIHIISLDDPTLPHEVARVYGAAIGTNLVHRDIKEFNGYLYCVADEGSSTLQIIDLHTLPDSVSLVYNSNEFVVTAHNLFIDTSALRLYALGAQGKTKVLDISNPVKPVLLATYPNANYYLPYVHDAYIDDNIGYMNCGGQGLWVVDFTDPQAPVTLGTLTDYPDQGYNHSGWVSEDGKYYFMCDETHGMDIKVVDISDPSNLKVVAKFSPGLWSGEIVHNVMVRGHLLYASYYYDGVQVWDISNPTAPRYWGYYDTYPGPNETFYAGNWGIYSLLPSNLVLASDMQGGLFVLQGLPQAEEVQVRYLGPLIEVCEGEPFAARLFIGPGFSSTGVSLEASLGGVPLEMSLSAAGPGDTVEVEVGGFPSTADTLGALVWKASDGIFQDQDTVMVIVHTLPAKPDLLLPEPGAAGVSTLPEFAWMAVDGAVSYLLQVAADSNAFEASIVFEQWVEETHLNASVELDSNQVYFWRVVASNAFCQQRSDVETFTTGFPSSTSEPKEAVSVAIFPNPARDRLTVAFVSPCKGGFTVYLCDNTGRCLIRNSSEVSQPAITLEVADLPPGRYWLIVKHDVGGVSVFPIAIAR